MDERLPPTPRIRSVAEFEAIHGLGPAEKALIARAEAGEICDVSMHATFGRPEDEKDGLYWMRLLSAEPEAVVRGKFLRRLLRGDFEEFRPHPRGVMLAGALIRGTLGLDHAQITQPVRFLNCRFRSWIILTDASAPRLSFETCWLGCGLYAARAKVAGDLRITSRSRCDGELDLVFAEIGGSLNLEHAMFTSGGVGRAINANGARVAGEVWLRNDFRARGEVNFGGAQIGGNLSCSGGKFVNQDGIALHANGAVIGKSVFLRDDFEAQGEVNFAAVNIAGQLDCRRGKFSRSEGIALEAGGAVIGANVDLSDGFEANGEVKFVGAKIAGQLNCGRGKFSNQNGKALQAAGAVVGSDVFLREGFEATGEINFIGAHIGGAFECDRGNFSNPSGTALHANSAVIGSSVFLREGFEAIGEVDFVGAKIAGQFDCGRGKFSNQNGKALHANGAVIGESVFLGDGFEAQGEVSLRTAHVERDVVCIGGRFTREATGGAFEQRLALDLGSCRVGGRIILRQPRRGDHTALDQKTHFGGPIDLLGARCARLVDDEAFLAAEPPVELKLAGFVYDALAGPARAEDRKSWLARQPKADLHEEFQPQPFEQLAKVLREMGHEEDAREIQMLKRRKLRVAEWRRSRRSGPAAWLRAGADWLFEQWLGHGFRPFRVLWPAIFLVLAGLWVFQEAYRAGAMAPNSAYVLRSETWIACAQAFDAAPSSAQTPAECWLGSAEGARFQSFSPLAYSIDIFIPIFDLHQETNWIPRPRPEEPRWLIRNARLWQWLQTGLGYLLTALAVAGFTGIVKQE